ncbi:unnamed protein product [Pleuronectes platessa]|uniref:Uncharacterized protein n=1 Tax=Pleuronectes platessa TaxID=8262 RepID=A0A9N7YBL5_PLEPL|nr:unnamed protein product [Pleuronectes platessa]
MCFCANIIKQLQKQQNDRLEVGSLQIQCSYSSQSSNPSHNHSLSHWVSGTIHSDKCFRLRRTGPRVRLRPPGRISQHESPEQRRSMSNDKEASRQTPHASPTTHNASLSTGGVFSPRVKAVDPQPAGPTLCKDREPLGLLCSRRVTPKESAPGEFTEVNKWVWNASVSHAEYLDTQALRKHVSGLSPGKQESTESPPACQQRESILSRHLLFRSECALRSTCEL